MCLKLFSSCVPLLGLATQLCATQHFLVHPGRLPGRRSHGDRAGGTSRVKLGLGIFSHSIFNERSYNETVLGFPPFRTVESRMFTLFDVVNQVV